MKIGRSSGILLHVTSLPGRYGIGDLGEESRWFVDCLAEAKQKLWCVLPLGPTGRKILRINRVRRLPAILC